MPKERPTQMDRVKAARCYINQAVHSQARAEELELHAFMSIFHPEFDPEKVRQMAQDRKRRPR